MPLSVSYDAIASRSCGVSRLWLITLKNDSSILLSRSPDWSKLVSDDAIGRLEHQSVCSTTSWSETQPKPYAGISTHT